MAQNPLVLITGAAGAVGSAVARRLGAMEHGLLLVDRDAQGVRALASNLPNAHWMDADAADRAQMEVVFAYAATFDVKAVILCSGVEGPVGPLESCADSDFEHVMRQNVTSVWIGLGCALRIMKRQGFGSIVALGSISSVGASPLLSSYAASKHAVMGLVRSAAREAAAFGVRVNAVCPAPIDSPMMQRIDEALLAASPARFEGEASARRSLPLGRYAEVEEVAEAIAFLCSDQSSYCSGAAFMVDGGLTCR